MRQKLIKNLKKEERIKFPKFSYKVYENESLEDIINSHVPK